VNADKRVNSPKEAADRLIEHVPNDLFKIDDTPENVAKALFEINPNEEGFEWEHLKSKKGAKSRT